MGNIVLLDELTINKIAAGEVIERPASVVKEMVENSIDAGAKNITVEIKNGGISFIKITDDGKGIAKDDVEMAFERHATSKIRTAEDLNTVKSLGFRGEALASIASIANVELVSKTESEDIGTKIVIEGGNILSFEEIGCSRGTTITVRNLFYNTPVRYKFLKRDFTESGYIEDVITRIALVHPEVAIKLINTGKTEISTNGSGNLQDIIYSIFGKEIATNIIYVDYEYGYIKIKGVIGKKEIAKANRSNQILFVNKRYIKDKTLTSAIDQAFKEILPTGKYAFAVLNIDIPSSNVDVNVHPAKLEVRFEDENTVFKAMFHAIKDSLYQENLTDTSEITNESKEKSIDEFKSLNVETNPIKTTDNIIEDVFNSKENEDNMQKNEMFTSNQDMIKKLKAIQESLKKEIELNPNLRLTDDYLQMQEKYNTSTNLDNNVNNNKNIIENASDNINIEKETETKERTLPIEKEYEDQEITIKINNEIIKEQIGEEDLKNISIETSNPIPDYVETNELIENNDIKDDLDSIKETNGILLENQDFENNKIKDNNGVAQFEQNIDNSEITEENKEPLADAKDKIYSFEEMYKQLFGKEPYGGRQETETQKNENSYTLANNLEDANLTIFENDEEYSKISYRVVGVAFDKYAILEINNELYIMNQNIAFEKIIYEKLKKDMKVKNNSQLLLLPDIITLSPKQMDIAKDNFELFTKCGFVQEEFGENTIKLSGVPEICVNLNTEELFKDLLEEINQVPRNENTQREEKFLSIIANKISEQEKPGTSEEEINDLTNQLLKYPNPFTALNGKPCAVKLSKYEIEKKFARK